jgi:hypothetical protein
VTATQRDQGTNYQQRSVTLDSHPAADTTHVTVRMSTTDYPHATLEFNGYWHSAHIVMSPGELAAVRDAINAVLMEAASGVTA